ncbi:MAG: hypothetical protein R6U63_05725 [Longimicrobiales bacterium]
MEKTVRRFSLNGEYVRSYGRAGFGPGELFLPRALSLAHHDSSVVVFDADGRVTFFSLDTSNDRAVKPTTIRLDAEIYDGCATDSLIFINGRRPGSSHVLHSYTLHGSHNASFGELYETDSRLISLQLSRGLLACTGEYVLFAPSGILELRAYTYDGAESWWIALADAVSIEFIQAGNGSYMRIPEEGYHAPVQLAAHGTSAIWQLSKHRGRDDSDGRPVLFSVVVDLVDRAADGVRSDSARVLAWDQATTVVEVSSIYPKILLSTNRLP